MPCKPEGNLEGLKPSETKSLQRLATRRFLPMGGFSLEQARELAAVSRLTGRQIGLVIDRQGRIEKLLVGTQGGLTVPELERQKEGRLRGVRFLHTHLGEAGLSREDLMDLLFLRFDSIDVLTVDAFGGAVNFQHAHLLPEALLGEAGKGEPFFVSQIEPFERVIQRGDNFTLEAQALEEELSRVQEEVKSADNGTRALLISFSERSKEEQERNLEELAALARTADVEVLGFFSQRVHAGRNMLSEGKLAELEVLALQTRANTLLFDGELSMAQMQTLAERTERRVLDRTQLILDIFARHATTGAGKLQVEMAQLKYRLPRLVGRHGNMDRLMGGLRGKGLGETKLELDRRRVRERISRIKKELDNLRKKRAATRGRRERQYIPVIALVGYTNAGKSTLLNTLTKSEVLAEDKLFATLDPSSRRLRFPKEHECLLSDTVGFIRDLPKELKEAFAATLEELEAASALLHVVDASHPEAERQMQAVEYILADMDLQEIPRLTLFNKWELTEPETRGALQALYPQAIPISAKTGQGLERVLTQVEAWLFDDFEEMPMPTALLQ